MTDVDASPAWLRAVAADVSDDRSSRVRLLAELLVAVRGRTPAQRGERL